jgi:hypothetical protein
MEVELIAKMPMPKPKSIPAHNGSELFSNKRKHESSND